MLNQLGAHVTHLTDLRCTTASPAAARTTRLVLPCDALRARAAAPAVAVTPSGPRLG
jgi:hypothetical protein